MTSAYQPEAGDLIWTDVDPRRRRDQAGKRPALVVSPRAFYRANKFAIVCSIASRVRPFASSVVLPANLPIQGEVLTSHVRSIDTLARPIAFASAKVPAAILEEARAKLAALMGIQP